MKTGISSIITLSLILAVGAFGQSPDTLRLLFIGNSLTYYNNMPWLVDSLAMSAGKKAIVDMSAFGGYSIAGHLINSQTLDKLAHGPWDYVVLQEHSLYPVVDTTRWYSWHPACWSFDTLIRAQGAITTLFMTWGWKNGGTFHEWGDSSIHFIDYFHMQDSVTSAYEWLAYDLFYDTLVPVGRAWARAKTLDSLVDLWEIDNNHPTLKGSYLSACVFYTKLFEANPIGLTYTAGLSPADALFLQTVAYETIYGVAETGPGKPTGAKITVHPNPFHTTTNICIGSATKLGGAKGKELIIYNTTGQRIKNILLPTTYSLLHTVVWDGTDQTTRFVPPGIYFIQLQSGDMTETAKIVRLK